MPFPTQSGPAPPAGRRRSGGKATGKRKNGRPRERWLAIILDRPVASVERVSTWRAGQLPAATARRLQARLSQLEDIIREMAAGHGRRVRHFDLVQGNRLAGFLVAKMPARSVDSTTIRATGWDGMTATVWFTRPRPSTSRRKT